MPDLVPSLPDLLRLTSLLALGLALWLTVTVALMLRALTRPKRKGYGWALARGLPGDPSEADFPRSRVDEWAVTSRGLSLPVWMIENQANPAGPTVVITHAWGESRVSTLGWAEAVFPWAGRLLLWDLPGHGEAEGWSTLGLREPADLRAVLESLAGEGERSGGRVVLLGLSMGAGIAIACGAELSTTSSQQSTTTDNFSTDGANEVGRDLAVCGVIAIGPPRRVMDAARRLIRAFGLPWLGGGWAAMRLLAWRLGRLGWFDRIDPAHRLAVPLLVLTGTEDVLCPPHEGRSLADAAPCGRFVELPDARHGDELRATPVTLDALARFLRERT